jgi:hypothetical protein
MRSVLVVPVLSCVALLVAACGGSEGPRRVYKVSLEGQSPAGGMEMPKSPILTEPPPPQSAAAMSPVWLRQNSPVEWTAPPGWTEEMSTAPGRIVEFTLEKTGPGGAPIQFVILTGGDAEASPAKVKQASFERAQLFYREDMAPQMFSSDHDGLRVTRYKIHGTFEGYPRIGASEPINEPNWTMHFGWVEGPTGSIMFKVQGPDAIMKPAEPKIEMLLNSMKPREPNK